MSPTEPRDHVGAATLECLAAAPNFNHWMFDRIRRWVGARVLEVGSGIGTLSEFLVGRGHVILTDTEPYYLDRLRERFGGRPNVEIARLYLPEIDGPLARRRFDTIICLNVLEHVHDDLRSLAVMRSLLEPAGRLVLLVPALPALFGTLDQALGHVRRYTSAQLRANYRHAGLAMRHLEYFNLFGIPGWWLTGRVLRRRVISAAALRLYDRLVPLFRLERLLPRRIGQSLIAVGEPAA